MLGDVVRSVAGVPMDVAVVGAVGVLVGREGPRPPPAWPGRRR